MSDRETLLAADRRHLWRPYTSSEDHAGVDPVVVEAAEGPYLITDDGRRLIDGSGSWWCNNLGHGHPRLRAALAAQSERMMHCTFAGVTHEPAVHLAEALIESAPEGLTRVFYSDNGSTSVEVALKIAFQYFQQNGQPERRRFLSLDGAYHGDTLGTMGVSAVDEFSGIFRPLLFDCTRSAPPTREGDFEPAFADLEAKLEAGGHEVAAVILEPLIQGAAGMRMYPPKYLRRIRDATERAGALLICDEVFTGFGRTGTMWACDQSPITPDLLCSAKGLSGGALPFAATLATERVYDGFRGDKRRALMHGHTFCGNPLGAAVALEVLRIYREEHVLEGVAERSAAISETMRALSTQPGVQRARSLGMVAAADLGEAGYMGSLGWVVQKEALERGAHCRPLGNTVYLIPPLNVPMPDLRLLLEIFEESIAAATSSSS